MRRRRGLCLFCLSFHRTRHASTRHRPLRDLSAPARAAQFCQRFGLRVPILMAPMASASPVSLGAAVANAGGMGGFGGLNSNRRGDCHLGQGISRRQQWRVPDQSVGPRPAAAARRGARAAGARVSRAMGPAGRRRRRRCAAAGFRPAMRRPARCPAARGVVDHGALPRQIRRRGEGARHRLVRLRDDPGRGARRRGRRRRRHRRAGVRGRRPSRRLRRRQGRSSSWSACSRWCRASPTNCRCRSSRPAASAIRAGSPRR